MKVQLKFQPISFSWVAVHPNPKGVVQFIGGAFFGSFPTLSYRYFLSQLFEDGYTIIALPFRFSFRHWPIAVSLLREQEILQKELTVLAEKLGYESNLYQDKTNYFWVGHSLGCKYIALLEFLSGEKWRKIVADCVTASASERVEDVIESMETEKRSILGQPSLLIAPNIGDTESAIPIPAIANFLDKRGWGVLPTRKQTQCFIKSSRLFNLTGLISFKSDAIAGSERDIVKPEKIRENSDVLWLIEQLKGKKLPLLHQEIPGKHLEPIGVKIGNYIVDLNPLDKFIKPLNVRFLEGFTIEFLKELKKREEIL